MPEEKTVYEMQAEIEKKLLQNILDGVGDPAAVETCRTFMEALRIRNR